MLASLADAITGPTALERLAAHQASADFHVVGALEFSFYFFIGHTIPYGMERANIQDFSD